MFYSSTMSDYGSAPALSIIEAAPTHLKSHLIEPKATLPMAMYHLAVEFTFLQGWHGEAVQWYGGI